MYFFLNGEAHGTAGFLSTAQVKVEPAIVEVNVIVALRLVDFFFGALVTVVSGAAGAGRLGGRRLGQRSWVTSP